MKSGVLNNQDFLQLTICHAAYADEVGRENVGLFYEAKNLAPVDKSVSSYRVLDALLFANGLVILKSDLSSIPSETEKEAVDECLRFEAYSFIKDCFHDHKFHDYRADGLIMPEEHEQVTNESCKKALKEILEGFDKRCLSLQRNMDSKRVENGSSGLLEGDRVKDITMLQGFMLYADALNEHLLKDKRKLSSQHIELQKELTLHSVTTLDNNKIAFYALFVTVLLGFLTFINDVYKEDGLKLPDLFHFHHRQHYLWLFWVFCWGASAYILSNWLVNLFSDSLKQDGNRSFNRDIYNAIHSRTRKALRDNLRQEEHTSILIFTRCNLFLEHVYYIFILKIAAIRHLVGYIPLFNSAFSSPHHIGDSLVICSNNQPLLYAMKVTTYYVAKLRHEIAERIIDGNQSFCSELSTLVKLLICFLMVPIMFGFYVLRSKPIMIVVALLILYAIYKSHPNYHHLFEACPC